MRKAIPQRKKMSRSRRLFQYSNQTTCRLFLPPKCLHHPVTQLSVQSTKWKSLPNLLRQIQLRRKVWQVSLVRLEKIRLAKVLLMVPNPNLPPLPKLRSVTRIQQIRIAATLNLFRTFKINSKTGIKLLLSLTN